jgi:hypothetical protein
MGEKRCLQAIALAAMLGPGGHCIAAQAADFQRAVQRHVEKTEFRLGRPCVHLASKSDWPRAHERLPDTRLEWTPAAFLVRLDREMDPTGRLAPRFALAARHGLFEQRVGQGSVPEYTMTWRGYAHTDGQGCFHTGSAEVDVAVRSIEPLSGGNYRVTTFGTPRELLPWAKDPEFLSHFTSYADSRIAYGTATYQVTGSGTVVEGRGSQETLGIPPAFVLFEDRRDPRAEAKRAGEVTPERVLAMVNAYFSDPSITPGNMVCAWLPHMVHDNNLDEILATPPGKTAPLMQLTLYGFKMNSAEDRETRIWYEFLSRLESIGLMRSQRIPASGYRGRPANGAIRFELTDAGRAMAPPNNPQCLLVGYARPVEILHFEPFTESRSRAAFVGRAVVEPLPGREALVARFGHLERLVKVGATVKGAMMALDGKLSLVGGGFENPVFEPDYSRLVPLPLESSVTRP